MALIFVLLHCGQTGQSLKYEGFVVLVVVCCGVYYLVIPRMDPFYFTGWLSCPFSLIILL